MTRLAWFACGIALVLGAELLWRLIERNIPENTHRRYDDED